MYAHHYDHYFSYRHLSDVAQVDELDGLLSDTAAIEKYLAAVVRSSFCVVLACRPCAYIFKDPTHWHIRMGAVCLVVTFTFFLQI